MKRIYLKPEIDAVRLDNEISLQLESVVETPTTPGPSIEIGGSGRSAKAADPYNYEGW